MDVFSPAIDFVTLLGGLITIIGAVAGVFAVVWKIYRKVDGWDDSAIEAHSNTEKLETLIATVDELGRNVQRVTDEVTSNGGNSMKDRLEQLTMQLAEHARRGDHRHQAIDHRFIAIEESVDAMRRQMTRHDPPSQ